MKHLADASLVACTAFTSEQERQFGVLGTFAIHHIAHSFYGPTEPAENRAGLSHASAQPAFAALPVAKSKPSVISSPDFRISDLIGRRSRRCHC